MVDFIPGYPEINEETDTDVFFTPAGPEFYPWLNAILKTTAKHWTVLTDDAATTTADHGKAYALAGYTLSVDAPATLESGWYTWIVGPGTIEFDDLDDLVLTTGEWAMVGTDGTVSRVMRGGRAPDDWVEVATVSNEATPDLADGDRFLITVDDDCEIQVPDNPRLVPFAFRILIDGGPHVITFASGYVGDPAAPEVLLADGDETVLSGIFITTTPSVTAVLGVVKNIPAA